MASYPLSQVQALVPPFWDKDVTFNLFQRSVQAKRIYMSGIKQRGGELFRVPLVLLNPGTAAVGWHAKGTTWTKSDINVDETRGATFSWAHIRASINIDPVDIQQYGSKDALVDYLEHKVDIVDRYLAQTVGTAFYSGSGGANPAQIVGLQTVAAAAATSYGGVADEANWAGIVDTTTEIDLDNLGIFIDNLTYDGEKPTEAYTTYAQVRKLISKMLPQLRFQDANMAKAGFKSVMVDADIPVFPDHLVPLNGASHQLFAYNSRYRRFIKDPRFFPFKSPLVYGQTGLDWVQSLLYSMIFAFTKRRTVGKMNTLLAT